MNELTKKSKLRSPRGATAGGGKGGGEGPVETADSLFSTQKARILDLVSEGEIVGLGADGLKNVYIGSTPVQNADDSYNYFGVKLFERTGAQAQSHIAGIPEIEATIGVGVEVKADLHHTETISDSTIDDVRVTLNIPGLTHTNHDTGDIKGSQVKINILVDVDGGGFVLNITDTIQGKSAAGFSKDYRIVLPAGTTRQIRMERVTADSTSSLLHNKTIWQSLTNIKNEKLTYPNSAVYGIEIDSEQFNSIPKRGYKVKGVKVQIPDNYDPLTRVYDPPVWTGTFVTDWTDNPAWIFYDLATNPRYGLGQFITPALVSKFDLFAIAQYCDTLVDDGFGGTEPRFTCNIQLMKAKESYQLLVELASVFRGMPYWSSGQLTAVQDSPASAIALFNATNVEEGDFNYSGSSISARHTVAIVSWNDPDNLYKAEVEYVENPAGIERYGIREKRIVAIGATSRGQAHRVGLWALYSEVNETEVVQFNAGYEATALFPGAIIKIQDPNKTNKEFGGRVSSGRVGETLIDEGFDPDPSWGSVGDVAVEHGKVVANIDGSVEANTFLFTTFTSRKEIRAKFKIIIEEDFAIGIVGHQTLGSGITTSGNGALLTLGLINASGELKLAVVTRTDAGLNTVTTSINPILRKEYTVETLWRASSAVAADDGIATVKLDGVTIFNETSQDSDTLECFGFRFGGSSSSGSVKGTLKGDDVLVREYVLEDFFDDPSLWNPVLGDAQVINGQVEVDADIGVGGQHIVFLQNTFNARNKLVMEYDLDFKSISMPTVNDRMWGSGFVSDATSARTAAIGIKNVAGTLQWVTMYRTDVSAEVENLHGTEPPIEIEKTYRLKLELSASTGPGSDNGFLKAWVNGTLIAEITGIDNDVQGPIKNVMLGATSITGTTVVELIIDNLIVAETGEGIEADNIPLDLPVTLETGKTYSLTIVHTDGTIENQSVSNPVPGTYSTLTVTAPFAAAPQEQSVWVLESDIEEATEWKVLSISEGEAGKREVMAKAHDADKFALIEAGIILTTKPVDVRLGTISPPVNLDLDEYLTTINGVVISILKVQWDEVVKARTYNVRWRLEDENWAGISGLTANHFEVPNAQKGIYTVQVTAVDGKGLTSIPAVTTGQVQGIDKLVLAPQVSGLELFEQGNETDFAGRDAKFAWRKAANILSFELGSEPEGGDSGSLDSFFRDYEIRVYDTDLIASRKLLRVEHVTDNFYTYTWEKNIEDATSRAAPNTNVAYRSFVIEVYQRNINNALSAFPAKLQVQNPTPNLPTQVTLASAVYNHYIDYSPPLDPDWVGMIVWRSTSPGFALDQNTKIHKGPETFVVLDGTPGVTYYFVYAMYDAFDEVDLIHSAEQVITLGKVDTPDINPDAITEPLLADLSVTEDKLQDAAVAIAKLQDSAVTEDKIAALAVSTSKIQTAAVTETELAAVSVSAGKIQTDAVTETKIQNDAISTGKIQANAVTATEIAALTITAAEIAALTITAGQIAANTITAGQIQANTITAAQIATGTITAAEIFAGTITTTEIAANTIVAGNIAAGTVTAAEIAAGTITATEIQANTITALEIAALTVTAAEIAALTITAAEIAANAIVADKIQAGAITADKILAASITADKYNELRNSQLVSFSDSVDATHPLEIEFPISSELSAIQAIRLSFRLKPYRAYSTGAAAGGTATSNNGGAQAPTSSAGGAQTSTNKGDPAHAHTYTLGPINPSAGNSVLYSGGTFRRTGGGTIYIGDHKVTLTNSGTGNVVSIDTAGNLRCSGGGTVTTDTQDGHNHTVTLANSTTGTIVKYLNGGIGLRAAFDGDNVSGAFRSNVAGTGTTAHQHEVANHQHTVTIANHTHTINNHTHDVVHNIFEQTNSPTVNVFADNGSGYGSSLGSFTTDQLEMVLTGSFSGSGWKKVKLESTVRARLTGLVELKLDIDA